jgi:hypothetical protein
MLKIPHHGLLCSELLRASHAMSIPGSAVSNGTPALARQFPRGRHNTTKNLFHCICGYPQRHQS